MKRRCVRWNSRRIGCLLTPATSSTKTIAQRGRHGCRKRSTASTVPGSSLRCARATERGSRRKDPSGAAGIALPAGASDSCCANCASTPSPFACSNAPMTCSARWPKRRCPTWSKEIAERRSRACCTTRCSRHGANTGSSACSWRDDCGFSRTTESSALWVERRASRPIAAVLTSAAGSAPGPRAWSALPPRGRSWSPIGSPTPPAGTSVSGRPTVDAVW